MTDAGSVRIPRYRAIAAELTRRIEQGQYVVGETLPTEWDLSREFQVARPTVRSALALLVSRGLVERHHGVGTLVSPRRLERSPENLASLSDELRAQGSVPGSRLVSVTRRRPPPDVAESLRVGSRSEVIVVARVRLADGVAIGLQRTHLPARFAPDLELHLLDDMSLAQLLAERYLLRAVEAELAITAVSADAQTASTLGCEPGAALLETRRVAYLEDARPFERTDGLFLPGHYEYRARQTGRAPTPRA